MTDEFERADLDLYVATHPRPQTAMFEPVCASCGNVWRVCRCTFKEFFGLGE